MADYKLIYESKENILGRLTKSKEWVRYRGLLRIKEGGKLPVSLEMTFVPPHPFPFNMLEKNRIQGTSADSGFMRARIQKLKQENPYRGLANGTLPERHNFV